MSYCVTINGLELLPQEDTLLIHYSITCTGTWYLQQLSTAYRNVCDTDWTVMYPNHQHPRHSDFPITVTQVSTPAVFAWNYGGIQGISAANFDAQHSYLVQLSIFNYDCFNTGQPTGGGGGSQTTGTTTGSTTGQTGGGSSGGGGGSGGNPGGGQPPTPGTPFPGMPPLKNTPNPTITIIPPGSSGPGGGTIPNPTANPGIGLPTPMWPQGVPTPTGVPTNPGQGGLPGGVIPSGSVLGTYPYPPQVPSASGDPFNYTSVYNIPGSPLDPNNLGIQTVSSVPILNNVNYNNTLPVLFTRPSNLEPGQTQNPNLNFKSLTISEAIPGETSVSNGATQANSRVNLNQINTSNQGDIPGTLSSRLLGTRVSKGPSINQVNTSNLENSAFIDLITASEVITIGEPIVVSCVFSPPTPMKARVVITIQDGNQSIPIISTSLIDISPTSPLTCGNSTLSSLYNLGELVITSIVYDGNNKVIGIKSIVVSNIEEINTGTYHSSKQTTSDSLPPVIINHGNLSNTPIRLNFTSNSSKFVILKSPNQVTSFSSALQVNGKAQIPYSLAVYALTGNQEAISDTDDNIPTSNIILGQDFIQSQAYSDTRYKINGEVVYPHTHNAGMSNEVIPPSNSLMLRVSPSKESTSKFGELYVSKEFSLREPSGLASATAISAWLPFSFETYGLVINGKVSGEVPSVYSSNVAMTSSLGVAVWSGLSLSEGDYYSVIQTTNEVVNPFAEPTLVGRYIV